MILRLIRTGMDRIKKTVLEPDGERPKSRYADDKAVEGFEKVAKEQGLDLDYDRDERLNKLLNDESDPAGNMAEIAKLLGQSKP